MVDRTILLNKLTRSSIPYPIVRWIAAFLSNRTQTVSCNGILSKPVETNLGVVQGSVLGPCLFSIMLADLRPLDPINEYIKFADDASLVSPESAESTFAAEFDQILSWSASNRLPLNLAKTKEIVFRRPVRPLV